jgi:hypothetical protein
MANALTDGRGLLRFLLTQNLGKTKNGPPPSLCEGNYAVVPDRYF